MSRSLYLICYDISDQKTLRKIHRLVSSYAIGGQKSFYECWMTNSDFILLFQSLENLIRLEADRIHCFDLDPRIKPALFGAARRQSFQPFMIL